MRSPQRLDCGLSNDIEVVAIISDGEDGVPVLKFVSVATNRACWNLFNASSALFGMMAVRVSGVSLMPSHSGSVFGGALHE